MGIRDQLRGLGKVVATGVADSLLDWAESPLMKAEKGGNEVPPSMRDDDEGQGHTPGGGQQDTAQSAPVPTEPTDNDPKSLFWDPFSIVEQLGYKDKPSQITYGTLKAMVFKTPVIQAIINTRVNQVASFANPQRDKYQMGFRIRVRDQEQKPTGADKKWIKQAESMILRTGVTDNPRGRDSFESFLRKFVWDSLVYDQACFEVVPNREGTPSEWYAVDSSTIRMADSAAAYLNEDLTDQVRYVQIYDGMIISEYTQEELCFGVRNPRTDLRLFGYGVSELEMLVPAITSLLWAWEYNSKFFSQGSAAKGILNFKGAIPDVQMRAFRRHWYQMLTGVENAWRTPITNADELQWINMQSTNRDMEYSAWMDFLIKTACSMFSMDPIEVNFKYGNTGQKGGLNESNNKEKITESKERGLRPLLRFVAASMNRHILWPINENFEFEFVGLDAATRDDMAKLNSQRVKTTWTVDELRAEEDLPALPDGKGEVILDPTWMQAAQMAEQPEGEGAPGAPDFGGEEDEGESFGDFDFEKLLAEGDEGEESGKDDNQPAKATRKAEDIEKDKAEKSMVAVGGGRNYVIDAKF